MELPREPTTIPQARRFPRTYSVDHGNTYRENGKIILNIPPTKNTYLTKDVKLHFDFSLTYREATDSNFQYYGQSLILGRAPTVAEQANETSVYLGTGSYVDAAAAQANALNLSVGGNDVPSIYNIYNKPIPTFDINGPYGLISNIKVYDYLGNTLLEDIPAHDVLTAQFADTWFAHENIDIDRNRRVDRDYVRKDPCATLENVDLTAPFRVAFSNQDWTSENTTVQATLVNTRLGDVDIKGSYAIDLFSFLGKLSDKFVPLHNGFRLELTVNQLARCIQFNTAWGGNRAYYTGICQASVVKPPNASYHTWDSYVVDGNLSNIYLKTDLLEVSPELDSKIDKLVFTQGWKYQQDFYTSDAFVNHVADGPRSDFTRRILPDLKSVTKIFVGQRPFNSDKAKQKLGYRIRNYVDDANLTYNKSLLHRMRNVQEVYQAYKECVGPLDDYLTMYDFSVDEYEGSGTNGNQLSIVTDYYQRATQNNYSTPNNIWFPHAPTTNVLDFGALINSFYQGRYLLSFDTRIPGATPNSIAGIDTSKNVLEYTLKSKSDTLHKVYIDVFVQHDAIIHVNPGESTAVSF